MNDTADPTVKVCRLCDASNDYYLKDNQCQLSDKLFCESIDPFTGDCLKCK